MSDRIDQYLDGNLNRDGLAADERGDADAAVRAISDTRAFIGARPAPDLTAAVMQRVKHGPHTAGAGVIAGLLRLLWTPREISIRPVYAVAAAGAVLAVALLVMPRGLDTQTNALPTATVTVDPRLFVQFRLQTDAMDVRLAGSFTNWEPAYELHQMAPGVWTITVPLPQGVHDYAFVVDGQRWVADPYAPGISDGFGGTNSRLTLLLPDTARL
jgi:Glycogen recognition site of AMP-activated protein kinase